jgi:multiple sugar transport system permease protein
MRRAEAVTAYACLFPSLMGLMFITYLPLLSVFVLSLTDWKGIAEPNYIGLANYIRLFTKDPYFFDSIKVTVYYAFLSVIGGMLFSLIVAMLLIRKIPARGFFRAVFYLPLSCRRWRYTWAGHGCMTIITAFSTMF